MVKNTPSDCMGNQPLWSKFLIAVGLLKNPWMLLLDKIGVVKRPVYLINNGLKVETRGGTTDINDAVVVLSGHEYPKELFQFGQSTQPVIIDCGGHIGTFTLYVKNLFPNARIFTFEPVAANRQLFQTNLQLNQIEQVTLIPKALYGESGHYYIDLSGKQFDAVSLQSTKPAHDQFIEVEAITPAQFFQDQLLGRIDLLKLDVEGSEYNIFAHSMADLSAHVRRLIMEYHPAGDHARHDEICNRFLASGWELIYETKNILGFDNLHHD